jgi:hypothetical protein
MSRTILNQVDGFTPVIDGIVQRLGIIPALVFGRMWRYCQMKDGVCSASQVRVGVDLGLSRSTINEAIADLVGEGYFEDTTPDLIGRPHVYRDTGKAGLISRIDATCGGMESGQPVGNSDRSADQETEPVGNSDTPVGKNDWSGHEPVGNSDSLSPKPVGNSDTKIVFKDSFVKDTNQENSPQKQKPIDALSAWRSAKEQCRLVINKAEFNTWLDPLKLSAVENGIFTASAANNFQRDWINLHVISDLEQWLTFYLGNTARVRVVVDPIARSLIENSREKAKA